MADDYDYVIIGGGMSGLSLVNEMINQQFSNDKTIAIIEEREIYKTDKIWSFWNLDHTNFDNIKLSQWDKFLLRFETNEILVESDYPYLSIDSGKFYQMIIEKIKQQPHIDLLLNSKVKNLVKKYDAVILSLESGNEIKAKQVFDSRIPYDFDIHPYGLWQHFKGMEIVTSDLTFNSSTVTLMDYNTSQQWGLQFVYVLPLTSNRAIIEVTWFSQKILPDEIYDDQLNKYLATQNIENYNILYEEKGVIPMTTSIIQQTSWDRVIDIGTRGGYTRASTGYTFLTTQWFSKKIVENLDQGKTQIPKFRSKWIDYLDEILLRVLSKYPELGPSIFLGLFEKNPHKRVIHFLSGRSSLKEEIALMINIKHKSTFLKEGIFAFFNHLKFR